ncbi:MAG: ATP-dependent helicase, partial [Alphaproteobacteria bacterium]|nr:ATP-dependent helicase [Alphaproteobacteria bacterium]
FIPSEYQKTIFKFVENGSGNAVINAKAGSAKTTTAVKCLDFIPKNKKVAFFAFNRSIVQEIIRKIGNNPNIDICTFHSLAHKILVENWGYSFKLNEFKYKSYLSSHVKTLSDEVYPSLAKVDREPYLRNINYLIDLVRFNLCETIEDIEDIVEKYGVTLIANEIDVVEKLFVWGKENINEVDYTDLVWLIHEYGIKTKKYKYDFIFIDEAQDTSPMQHDMVKKCFKKNTRFLALGDYYQCINAWAGADKDAFKNLLNEPNTIELPLPISYRCPKSVIRHAQRLVPDIEAAPNAPEGSVVFDVSQYKATPGDMILCRTTAPLVKLQTEFLSKNIGCYIKGSEIGKSLIHMVEGTGFENLSVECDREGVMSTLTKNYLKILAKLMDNIDLADAVETDAFLKYYDSVRAIEILSTGLFNTTQLKDRINTVFKDKSENDICLSTVHKAKGLEANNVFILCPSLIPSRRATLDWEIEAERNLEYVAITRAKKNLYYIDETLFSPRK